MKPITRIGRRERDVVEVRRAHGYHTDDLRHFGDLEETLRALLDRLLPGVASNIDLVSFVDAHVDAPLGRGDRRDGVPPTPDLLLHGVAALAEDGFRRMSEGEQRELIHRLRHGEEVGSVGEHGREFIDRLLEKALQGYLAHPDTWQRIGFNGPAYPEGYAWIGTAEVAARHDEEAGWDKL